MFTTTGIEKIRSELMEAVRRACQDCTAPHFPADQLRFDDPPSCPCRCERTDGILRAAADIVKNGPTKPLRRD